MKYKAGDIVKIKTWEEMEKEYGLSSTKSIKGPRYHHNFIEVMEKNINKLSFDRILEIKEVQDVNAELKVGFYSMKNHGGYWYDYMIKGLAREIKIIEIEERINSRFEILDIR